MIPRLLALLLCLYLPACSHSSYQLGEPIDALGLRQVDQAQDLAMALALFGPPQRLAAVADGYVLGWEHWEINERSLGVSLGAWGAELFAVDWGRAQLAGEFLLLRFDRDHRLTARSFNRWDERGGGGAALQTSLALVDVVDVDDLLEPMSQHRWGALSLEELPVTLNRASNPDSGAAALEQRGTPTGAGQRSLEMRD